MNVKENVLNILEENKGRTYSGSALAKELGVSRNAVWKAIQSLKDEGYDISAASNKGYCLSIDNDIFSQASIRKYIKKYADILDITVVDKVASTNTAIKEEAANKGKEGRVLIAKEQTAGKGRMQRRFHSPSSGIYMSILLRPDMSAENALYITTAAAVAVARAIEDVSSQKAEIKWVNDIYCKGKKVSGILTEASVDVESGRLEYAVLGIGINVSVPEGGFSDDIKEIATAIFDGKCDEDIKSRLVAAVLEHFFDYYKDIENKSFMKEYKERLFVIGREINVINGNEIIHAVAEDIDDEAHLIVRLDDGTRKVLSSGEISTKVL